MNYNSSRTKYIVQLAALKFKELEDRTNTLELQERNVLVKERQGRTDKIQDTVECEEENNSEEKKEKGQKGTDVIQEVVEYENERNISVEMQNSADTTEKTVEDEDKENISVECIQPVLDQEASTSCYYKASCSVDRPMIIRIEKQKKKNYIVSPIHTDESDVDDSDADPHYDSQNSENSSDSEAGKQEEMNQEEQEELNPEEQEQVNPEENPKKGKKRKANPDAWSFKKAKYLRNSGKAYTSASKTKRMIPARNIRPPCGDKCRLQCREKIKEDVRESLFSSYWQLSDIQT